jgi:hypothetical protein
MFKTKKRFRKTHRKKNIKSLHSKNKKTYNKLKHKKTHKKKIQHGGGLKCNTRVNLPVYVVMGHGQTTLTLKDIPADCIYVSFTETLCNSDGNNPTLKKIIDNIFDSSSGYHSILKDPCKYWTELKENFSNPLNASGVNIHYPHENPNINQYVDVLYILFTYIYGGDQSRIYISGIYEITHDVIPQTLIYMTVKDSDIIDPKVMEFAYKYSISPTFDQVMAIINSHNGMTYNQFNAYAKTNLRITQSTLFANYPGIFYNILCKSIDPAIANQGAVIDTAARLRRRSIDASREIDAENIMLAYVSLPYEEMVTRKNEWPGALRGETRYGCEINVLLFLNLITPERAQEIMDELDKATTNIGRHITLSEIINNIFHRSDLFEITYDTTQDVGDTTGITAIAKITNLYNYILNELPNRSCILIKLNRLNYLGHTIILMKYSNNLFSYDPQFTDTSKNVVRLQSYTPKIFNEYYLKNGFVSATIIYCRDKSSQLINKLEPMQVIEDIASGGGFDLPPPPVLSGILTCTSPTTCTSANLVVSTESSGGGTRKPCYTSTCNPMSGDEDYHDSGDQDNTSSASSSNNKNTKILKNIYTTMGIPDTNVSGDIQDSKIQEIKDNEREFLKYTIMHNINKILENEEINDINYLITTLELAGLDVPNLTASNRRNIDNFKKYFETKNVDEIYDKISLDLFKKLFE